MNKILRNQKIKRVIFISVIFVAIVNIVSLLLWYSIRIKPTIDNNEIIKEEILHNKLNKNYAFSGELKQELKKITKEYNIYFEVIDDHGKTLLNNGNSKFSTQLFSDIVQVSDRFVVVNAYLYEEVSPVRMILSLLIFQVTIILILMIIAYLFTRETIISPVEKLVNDIKNYKFGKKPTRNNLNSEFDIIQNEFVNLVDSLENEKAEQKRIIASISHDIKTPLTSIIGYSSLMDSKLTKKEMQKYSVKINEKALHMKDILQTFDDYLVNYDNKKIKLNVVSIKDLINELNKDYKIELANNNIQLNIKSNCPKEKIKIDILKIKRVFSNIISNSTKFIKGKGIIDINIIKDKDYIEFTISDNGIGIDEKIIDKIFDPFFTTDQSRKISGLGLSICKEFIEIHGGTIEAFNNNGLTIRFKLPVYNQKDKI